MPCKVLLLDLARVSVHDFYYRVCKSCEVGEGYVATEQHYLLAHLCCILLRYKVLQSGSIVGTLNNPAYLSPVYLYPAYSAQVWAYPVPQFFCYSRSL